MEKLDLNQLKVVIEWKTIIAAAMGSDVVGEQKSGSGRVRGRHFGFFRVRVFSPRGIGVSGFQIFVKISPKFLIKSDFL